MFDSEPNPDPASLMTIGYEGADLSDFLETLKAAGVRHLIDVRELPLSRKKGFSKKSLCEAVEAEGISYTHVRQLGDPKPGRDAAKSGDLATFRNVFGTHIRQPKTREALQTLVPVVSGGGVCLLCFERHHVDCHRSIVADELVGMAKVKLRHLGVKHGIAAEPGN